MKIVPLDILTASNVIETETVILHGCNCFHSMGGGIARYLANRYPDIEKADKKFGDYSTHSKMGNIDIVKVDSFFNVTIINCYTQYKPGTSYDPMDLEENYNAIRSCLSRVRAFKEAILNAYSKQKFDIRSPKIGCGIAGGDWNIVEKIFEEELPECMIYEI